MPGQQRHGPGSCTIQILFTSCRPRRYTHFRAMPSPASSDSSACRSCGPASNWHNGTALIPIGRRLFLLNSFWPTLFLQRLVGLEVGEGEGVEVKGKGLVRRGSEVDQAWTVCIERKMICLRACAPIVTDQMPCVHVFL